MSDRWSLEVQRRRQRSRILGELWRAAGAGDAEAGAVIAAERSACARDLAYWIDNYVWVTSPQRLDADNPYRSTEPMVLYPRQRELLAWFMERFRRREVGVVGKSRELGVSWLMCAAVYALARDLRGFSALLLSRKRIYVDESTEADRLRASRLSPGRDGARTMSLFGKLDFIDATQPPWIRPDVDRPRHPLEMVFPGTGSRIAGESTNAGAGRGDRRSVVIVDEMAAMQEAIQSSVWRALASVAGCRIAVSSAGLPWSEFERLRDALPQEQVLELDWTAAPDRNEAWKSKQVSDLGSLEAFLIEFGVRPIVPSAGRIWDTAPEQVAYSEGELLDREPEARSRWRAFGAWDFGSGPSLLVCLVILVEYHAGGATLWVDREFTWSRQAWPQVSSDVVHVLASEYVLHGTHWGDPSGRAAESGQTSWESNLRAGGIPVECLPGDCNTRDQREWQIRSVGQLLALGQLRIHERCTYLLSCVERWTRHLSAGESIDTSARQYVPPRHDQYSHGGTALCFAAAGLVPMIAAELGRPVRGGLVDVVAAGPREVYSALGA